MHEWARSDTFFMQAIGGADGLTAFINEARNLPAELCPCCGSAPAVSVEKALNAIAVKIYCPECGIQTKRYLTGKVITGAEFSARDRLGQAATAWNTRRKPAENR